MPNHESSTITYYGWSALGIETRGARLFFDPFYRPYCGAQWFDQTDFRQADHILVTHGHEEHFLDVPPLAKATGAKVVGPRAVTRFLARRHGLPSAQLSTLNPGESTQLAGIDIHAFDWKHRDINLVKALTKAVFGGNATQLSWAFSSATRAPFYSPYTGYHLTLADGLTVLNYNEGFNSKMTDAEITALGSRFETDVLLAGMQLDFVADVARGAAALAPKIVMLYPPHKHFHGMMGVSSRPWSEFADAVREAVPTATVIVATPGTRINGATGEQLAPLQNSRYLPGNS